jgi:hypothetical protein
MTTTVTKAATPAAAGTTTTTTTCFGNEIQNLSCKEANILKLSYISQTCNQISAYEKHKQIQ